MNRTANKIINTAIKLFIGDGVRKTTMDDLAAYANVSKATIYKYFRDKDDLFADIARCMLSDQTTILKDIVESTEDLPTKLCLYLDALCEFSESGKFTACEELVKTNPEIEAEYKKYVADYKRTMLILIRDGIEKGLIKNSSQEEVFYYIDMSVLYYQHNAEYRERMRYDHVFQKRFMQFYIGNIFENGGTMLERE